MAKLDPQDAETRRKLTTISDADVEACKAFVKQLKGTVRYPDGNRFKTIAAARLRAFWDATLKRNDNS